MTDNSAQSTSQHQFAGLGRRFWALVIDFFILSAVFFPVTRIVKGTWLMTGRDHLWNYGLFITDPLCLVFLAVILLYFVLLEGLWGGTPGKKLLGMRVIGPDSRNPGIGRALIRNLLRAVDALPALNILGVVLILTSPEKARLGDRAAGTRVVLLK